jgi:REP element-mobilizing transposase RayT
MKHRRRWRTLEGDYHAFNRGARRLRIFADDGDRGYFLRLIGLTARKHAVRVTSWCLMDNHYHLTLRGDGLRMGRMIRDLEKTYARSFNQKTGHEGALFEGRFGSVRLPDVETLAYVTRYVHANCRDKGVSPERYPWSSARAYLGLSQKPFWLLTEPVLAWAGGVEGYRRYLADVPPLKRRSSEADAAQAAFVEHIRERVVRELQGATLPGKLTLESVAGWAALRLFGLRPKTVAPLLGYASGHTLSSVVHRLDRRKEEEPLLAAALQRLLIK